ncbi:MULTISPECIES: TetR/AcrR family transcriptional regulator [unclassified Microbacterium]|uniref:TetR/AcrR family transcriptional regulator n=1 Tax=unclassified Microbacterium TaxID=2609290 RepID=UPI001385E635|nr:TetR family transcriptional regulator [Microbacterium sp. MAH-37]
MSNREKLLKAAKECLLTVGYERTTVRHLVAASGANQASINYHFGSKEQLLILALRQLNQEWGDVLFAALAAPGGTEATHDGVAVWSRIIESIQANRDLWAVNFESLSSARGDDEIRGMIAEGQRLAREALARTFSRDSAADPDAVGARCYAVLVGLAAQWIIDPASAPSAEQIAAGSLTS